MTLLGSLEAGMGDKCLCGFEYLYHIDSDDKMKVINCQPLKDAIEARYWARKLLTENAALKVERDAAIEKLEKAKTFHPRAMKLIEKEKPFLVVACDEPYYLDVYYMIRKHEVELRRWTKEDEERYQQALQDIEKG